MSHKKHIKGTHKAFAVLLIPVFALIFIFGAAANGGWLAAFAALGSPVFAWTVADSLTRL